MSQPIYQQLDPVRSNPAKRDADALAHRTSNGVDPKAIEALKAARNQVVQVDESRSKDNKFAPLEARPAFSGTAAPTSRRDLPLTGFAEEFVQKLTSIEKETAEIDEEMAKLEKLWSSLVEKKKQLEARRNELIKVKDKITTLNKEMDDVLSKELGVRNYLVV